MKSLLSKFGCVKEDISDAMGNGDGQRGIAYY